MDIIINWVWKPIYNYFATNTWERLINDGYTAWNIYSGAEILHNKQKRKDAETIALDILKGNCPQDSDKERLLIEMIRAIPKNDMSEKLVSQLNKCLNNRGE